MTFYLDASAAVALITPEPASERVADWIAAQMTGSLHISDWVLTEVASALSLKVRSKSIAPSKRDDFELFWYRFQITSLTCLEVRSDDFRSALRLLAAPSLGLRAGDALHLAIAARCDVTVATLDATMTDAGRALGVATLLL